MSRRILVTGGSGFIGSHLCDRLLSSGCAVICLDDFSSGDRENVVHLLGTPGFSLVEQDVMEALDHEVDEIYHLACPASPVQYQRDPIRTMKTAWLGTLHVLENASRNGARVLLASTSEVYGDPAVHPQPESYFGNVNPIGLRACYDEGKRAAESLCFDYQRCRAVDVRVARIFNTYGPRMRPDDGRVVSNFIAHSLAGEDLVLHGKGTQTRSFCYVDDLVEGLVTLMDSDADIPGPVNLGFPKELSIEKLATMIIELTGSSSSTRNDAVPADDPVRRWPDISRARTLLGWAPRVQLREGLQRTIEWHRERSQPPGEAVDQSGDA